MRLFVKRSAARQEATRPLGPKPRRSAVELRELAPPAGFEPATTRCETKEPHLQPRGALIMNTSAQNRRLATKQMTTFSDPRGPDRRTRPDIRGKERSNAIEQPPGARLANAYLGTGAARQEATRLFGPKPRRSIQLSYTCRSMWRGSNPQPPRPKRSNPIYSLATYREKQALTCPHGSARRQRSW